MKHTLLAITILLALALFACAEQPGTDSPEVTSDEPELTTDLAETEPPVITDAALTEAAEKTPVEVEFYKDDTITVTRAGNKFSFVYPQKLSRTYSFELPTDREYTDIQVVPYSGNYYFFAVDDSGKAGMAYLSGKASVSSWYSPYLEFNGMDFYYNQGSKFSIAVKDGKFHSIHSNKYFSIELKNGTALLRYYPRMKNGEEEAKDNINVCSGETLEPIKDGRVNQLSFKKYQVDDGVMSLFTENGVIRYDGSKFGDTFYDIIWSDKNYFVLEDNRSYSIYDSELNLLYDWGYVGDAYHSASVKVDNGNVTLKSFNGIVLHYPEIDIDTTKPVYSDESFTVFRTDSCWYFKSTNRNYYIDIGVKSESDPIILDPITREYASDYTITSVYFLWPDTVELISIDTSTESGVKKESSVCQSTGTMTSYDWNGYKVIHDGWSNAFVLSGRTVLLYTDDGMLEPCGNMLECYYNATFDDQTRTFYNKELKPISETQLTSSSHLADGGVVGIIDNHFEGFDADGNLVSKSGDHDKLLLTKCDKRVAEYGAVILAVDDGQLILLDTDDNVVAKFGDYDENRTFHWMLSDYFEKVTIDYPNGYYFIFEDNNDTLTENDITKIASIECWYAPDTGESGVIKSYIEGGLAYAKPVLYLYPEETTEVTVQFEHPERLTTVYPAYNNGWTVTASPDGNLFDGRRNYYALYWEENSDFIPDFRTGFIVEDNYDEFLEEKLDEIGLSEREANEFIMYWLPILEKNGKSIVHFELTESRENNNRLLISPAPDSLLRVAIHIKKADGSEKVVEQQLEHFERTGFTAVEWGGRVYD